MTEQRDIVERLKSVAVSTEQIAPWVEQDHETILLAAAEITKLRQELAEVPRLREQLAEFERNIDRLANSMVYRGNSVAYIYDKCEAYKKGIDTLREQLRIAREGLEKTENWRARDTLARMDQEARNDPS